MSNKANIWLVTCVKRKDGRIEKLGVTSIFSHERKCKTRAEVLGEIDRTGKDSKKADFRTPARDKDGNDVAGPRIRVVGDWFLRTDANDVLEDNLGELPECTDC